MRFHFALLTLVIAAWGAARRASLGACGMRRVHRRLAAGGSDMRVDFYRAVVVSRTHSDANVFDVTTRVDVDATL